MSARRVLSRALIGATLTLGLLFAFASAALAAPDVPVLHFDDLRTALSAAPSHQLDGYMITCVSGVDTTHVPVTVL